MIGILNAYHFDANDVGYQSDYSLLFLEFVQNTFPERKNEIVEFKVALGQFPESPDVCDIWFITGSPKSVYEDLPWIHDLSAFVKELHLGRKKTIAICFGHQMVAHALGGRVAKSAVGWGVGIRSFDLIKHKNWMTQLPEVHPEKMSLLFSHQDQVEVMPKEAELLAGDKFCPFQMMQIGEHIMTMQGHPEFTVAFARERLISRKDKMSSEVYEKAMASYADHSDFTLVTEWIRQFVYGESKSKVKI